MMYTNEDGHALFEMKVQVALLSERSRQLFVGTSKKEILTLRELTFIQSLVLGVKPSPLGSHACRPRSITLFDFLSV